MRKNDDDHELIQDQLEKQAEYFYGLPHKNALSATVKKDPLKRISINIPESFIAEATTLGAVTGNGYQSVLKIAMAMGLAQLRQLTVEE